MIFIIIFAVIIAIGFFCISPALRRHPDADICKNLFVAHRGLHSIKNGVPENSLPAFKLAVEHGYGIEIDIHLTRDGEVIVFHDDTLERVCGVKKRICDITYNELSQYCLYDTDERIPTLKQVLELVSGKSVLLIEFKCPSHRCAGLCKAADNILKEYNGKYLVQSFNPLPLRWYKKNRPDICRGQLSTNFFKEPKNNALKTMVGVLMLNMISRPDFISYDRQYVKSFSRRICSALGAIRAGWTFKSEQQVLDVKDSFDIFIFEGFMPKN